jgi:hypothetical protein
MNRKIANVVLCIPNIVNVYNLNGYNDFAATVNWGLNALGYSSHLTLNALVNDADVYFLFGGHMLPYENIKNLKGKVYYVNLEQLHGFNLAFSELNDTLKFAIENFNILDYSEANFPFWNKYNVRELHYFPPAFGDNLIINEINEAPANNADVDLFYYGNLGFPDTNELDYKAIFLKKAIGSNVIRPKSVLLQNDYSELRNEFIRRSKIVLSVTADKVFPTVRSQLLLANKKFVLSSLRDGDYIDRNYSGLIEFATIDTVAQKISELLDDQKKISELAGVRSELFRNLNIKLLLKEVL